MPSQGAKELLADATAFLDQAKDLCFTAVAEGEEGARLVSLAGDRSSTVGE